MAPLAPIGCPKAMAPPFGLVFSFGKASSLATAKACAAKASLDSITSISSTLRPARSSAILQAATGPMPIISLATPHRP